MVSETRWRWVDRKGVQRALSLDALKETLRSGAMGRDVPVWREGMEAFEPAGRVPELAGACVHAPATTPGHAVPAGEVIQPTSASLEALRHMVQKEKQQRGLATAEPDRRETPTVPPPGKTKKTVALGSVAPGAKPLPPSPMTSGPMRAVNPPPPVRPPSVVPVPPRPPSAAPIAPPPKLPIGVSPAAVTCLEMQTPGPGQDGRVDTPPATPIAIHASGRRASTPVPPESPGVPVPAIPPPPAVPAEQSRNVRTVPPSRLDQTMPSAAMRAEFERQARRRRILRIAVPIASVLGVVVVVGLVGLVVLVMRKNAPEPVAATSASAAVPDISASASASAAPQEPVQPAAPAQACTSRDVRKRLVVGASKDVPLEVWSHPDERLVAVGFAARNQTALGFALDPRTLSPERSFTKQVASTLTRVVPHRSGATIGFETDEDGPTATVRNTLTVATDPPRKLGTFKGSLTISLASDPVPEILWKLPFQDPLEAMRAVAVPGKGMAVVFRVKTGLWMGWIGEDQKPIGELHKLPGTGEKVGTPALGWNGRHVLVTFADLQSAESAWTVRVASVAFGEAVPETSAWTLPDGGSGPPAISPAPLGLPDGRWVLVWTEGPSGSRSVRVQTLDADMNLVGKAFSVSKAGDNAGQGLAAVGKQGGVVVYLTSLGQFYEVWGAGIDCP